MLQSSSVGLRYAALKRAVVLFNYLFREKEKKVPVKNFFSDSSGTLKLNAVTSAGRNLQTSWKWSRNNSRDWLPAVWVSKPFHALPQAPLEPHRCSHFFWLIRLFPLTVWACTGCSWLTSRRVFCLSCRTPVRSHVHGLLQPFTTCSKVINTSCKSIFHFCRTVPSMDIFSVAKCWKRESSCVTCNAKEIM